MFFGFRSELKSISFFVVVFGFEVPFLREFMRDTVFFGFVTLAAASSKSSKASAALLEYAMAYRIR
jgi:hypothetical protein